MARATASLEIAGGVIGLLGTGPGHSAGMHVGLIRALGVAAIALGLGVWRTRRRLPRWSYHLLVLAGTVLITAAVTQCGGVSSAISYACVYLLVAIEASFFFRWPAALAHLGFVLVASQGAFSVVGVPFAGRAVPLALIVVVAAAVSWLARRVDDAETDSLTGLVNRRGLDRALRGELRTAARDHRPLTVALLDLDHFQAVNDLGGRGAGDRVLRNTAQAWRGVLVTGQVLGRYSGDGFALVLPGHTPESAVGVVRRLCDQLPEGRTCSVGIVGRSAGDSLSLLINRADAALYEAKRGGRDRIVSRPVTDTAEQTRELGCAIDAGELFVVYQPLVDLSSAVTIGVEALVRWRHPRRGVLGPDEFIAVAEAGDLIHRLGHFVLDAAVGQGKRWRDRGLVLEVAVNASGRELSCPDYAAGVVRVLTEAGLPADQLTVEVTETTLDADSPQVLATLAGLRAAGVRVALDDFGTGYSSLSRLDRLPVDVVKIDQSFIRPLQPDSDTAVLAAVVALGAALGLDVVGEGVETLEQAAMLSQLGCGFVQGHHFGRPAEIVDDAAPTRADHPAAGSVVASVARPATTSVPVSGPASPAAHGPTVVVAGRRPALRRLPQPGVGGRVDRVDRVGRMGPGQPRAALLDPAALLEPAAPPDHAALLDPAASRAGRVELLVAAAEAELADLECRRYTRPAGIADRARRLIRSCSAPALATQRSRARLVLADQQSRTEGTTAPIETAQAILLGARARGHLTVAARAEALIAWCLDRTGARGDALAHAVEAVRLLPSDAPAHLVVDHRMMLALFNALQAADDGYTAAFDEVLAEADRLANPDLLLSVLNSYAWTLWDHGRAAAARPLVDRVEALSAAAGIALNSTMLDTVASVLLDTGDVDRAETVARLMVDPATPESETRAAPEALLTLARIRLRRGDPAEALELVLRAEQVAEARGLPEVIAMATMDKSTLLAQTGSYQGAYEALSVSYATWVQVRDRDADARASSLQALFETEQARRRSAIFEELADRDALTGLWNRRHLDRVLPELLADHRSTGTPLSIAILDVDHFKRVNDDRNHATGDTVLTRIGELLRRLVPEPGLAARLGGEEFLLALPGADAATAQAVCERTRQLIGHQDWEPVTAGIPITVSIGHATADPTATVASLLGAADAALYDAKKGGRDQVRPGAVPACQQEAVTVSAAT